MMMIDVRRVYLLERLPIQSACISISIMHGILHLAESGYPHTGAFGLSMEGVEGTMLVSTYYM